MSEGWTVAATAHHIAVVQRAFVRLVTTLATGQTYSPSSSMDEIDRGNARHAEEYAAVGKPETLALLRTSGDAIARLLHGLGDEQFDRSAGTFGGRELRVAQVVEYVVIGHARYHLASIQATLAAVGSPTARSRSSARVPPDRSRWRAKAPPLEAPPLSMRDGALPRCAPGCASVRRV